MRISPLPLFHSPTSVEEAKSIQQALCSKLVMQPPSTPVKLIAGVDVGYDNVRQLAHASIVVMSAEDSRVLEQHQQFTPVSFPYVPGLLAFREIPAILAVLETLKIQPDLLMVDGHGIAHPKRMGIATHLGILLDMPTIGVGKSRLTGRYTMPGIHKGEHTPLMAGKEQIGIVLRSRDNVRPLFISPGHRMNMASSLYWVLHFLTRYRLPEPTRLADKYSKCKKPALVT